MSSGRGGRRGRAVVAAIALAAGVAACTSSGGGPAPTTATPRSTGSSAAGATSTEVTFTADGTKTYGTLLVPAHGRGQRLAAALLIPGSGPTDRDGNDAAVGVTPSTLRVLADLLAARGVASLRFDKYFTGRTGRGRLAADPSSATIDNDLQQATDAYDYLAHRSEVDPAKLLIVGHSEGGMIALHIASTDPTKPAGLALLEPQDLRAVDLIRVQTFEAIDSLVAQGTLSAADGRQNAALVRAAVTTFRSGGTVSTAGMATPIAALVLETLGPSAARYVRTWDAIVPAALAAKVRAGTRVLVTDGTRDTNVPPRTITPLVRALKAAGAATPGLVLVPDGDHFMHLPSQPVAQPVLAPAVVSAVTAWAQPYAR